MRRSTTFFLGVALATGVLVTACREQPTQPSTDDAEPALTGADSAVILARIAAQAEESRSGEAFGGALVTSQDSGRVAYFGGTLTDTLEFTADVDSFQVELVDRECAAASNEVSVVSPDSTLLSEWMCQEGAPGLPGQTCWPPGGGCSPTADPADTSSIWSFTSGYSAGEGVVLDFETGVSGATGEMNVEGSFPSWTVYFEDGFDSDFNDFELEVRAVGDFTPTLSFAAADSALHPWVTGLTVNGDGQTERIGDSATVTLTSLVGTAPDSGRTVSIALEFLMGSGGHAHIDRRVPFTDAPLVSAQSAEGHPVFGFFVSGTDTLAELTDTTDASGEIDFTFYAGFLGGQVEVVASTVEGVDTIRDTLLVDVAVPGLVDLQSNGALLADAYFIGATTEHPRDSTWFATSGASSALAGIAAAMEGTPTSASRYIHVNDASLPRGGSFTVNPPESAQGDEIEDPFAAHRSHALGVDVDIGWCYAAVNGEDGGGSRVSYSSGCTATEAVSFDRLRRVAEPYDGIVRRHRGAGGDFNHYHIRFTGGS